MGREGRAGHASLGGEGRHRPRALAGGVQGAESRRQAAVAQGGEPAGLGRLGGGRMGADGLDEQDVGQAADHDAGPQGRVLGLQGQELQGGLEDVTAIVVHVGADQVGHQLHQRPRPQLVEGEPAGDHRGRGAGAADGDRAAGPVADHLEAIAGGGGGRIPEAVARAAHHHIAVAGHQADGGGRGAGEPGLPGHHQAEAGGFARGEADPPGGGGLQPGMDGGAHPHGGEDVVEGIHGRAGLDDGTPDLGSPASVVQAAALDQDDLGLDQSKIILI